MTANVSIERIVTDWLRADGPQELPIGVLDRSFAEARIVGQSRRRPRLLATVLDLPRNLRRAGRMPTPVWLALLIALILAVTAAIAGGSGRPPAIVPPAATPSQIHVTPSAAASTAAVNGLLAYRTGTIRTGQSIVAVKPPSTTPVTLVTAPPGVALDAPQWSPDGRTLAYWRTDKDGTVILARTDPAGVALPDLYMITTDMSTSADHAVAWAPDSSAVAIPVRNRVGTADTIVIESMDGTGHPLDTHYLHVEDPAWSPDGSTIVFRGQGENKSTYDLYAIGVDGTGPTNLTQAASLGRFDWIRPGWGPASHEVVSYAVPVPGSEGNHQLWIIGVDCNCGGIRIADAKDLYAPAWSPDGRRIAAIREAGTDRSEVILADPEGGVLGPISTADDPVGGGPLEWSPDGHSVAVAACADQATCGQSIMILPADAGGLRAVVPMPGPADDQGRMPFTWARQP